MSDAVHAPGHAPVNGVELWHELHGTGRPLVLIHGGFGSVAMFGPVVAALAAGRQVIGVDLQAHGHTRAFDRPMRFETMADDIAALIHHLGHERADVMGFSLGGAVALRTAIQHPAVVNRLVLVSTPFRRTGWYPEMLAGMDQIGPETAEWMRQTPLFEAYARIAPNVDDWPVLATQLGGLLRRDYDWSAAIPGLTMPVLLVAGDADGVSPAHVVAFFELLGGGQRDGGWDGAGMTRHRLAILPGETHYTVNTSPELARTVARFLDPG